MFPIHRRHQELLLDAVPLKRTAIDLKEFNNDIIADNGFHAYNGETVLEQLSLADKITADCRTLRLNTPRLPNC